MRHTQEDEHEPIPVDESIEPGFFPDGYEQFLPDEWRDDEADSTEETPYNPTAQLTDNEEDDFESMPRKKLVKILEDLDQHKFGENGYFYLTIKRAILNALKSFIEEDVKNMHREKLEEALSNLNQNRSEKNPELHLINKKALSDALRPFIHEEFNITELESKRDPNQPKLCYATDTEIFEMFPKTEPQPVPERKPIDLVKRLPKNQPIQRYATNAEVHNLFEPQTEPQPAPERKSADIIQMDARQKPHQEIVRYDKGAQMYEFPGTA